MKSYFKIQLVVCSVVCLLSCRDRNDAPLVNVSSQELNLSFGIETSDTRSAVLVEGVRFEHESQINVLLVDYNGTGNSDYNNAAPYIYKDPTTMLGAWLPTDASHPLTVNRKEALVLAHYPAYLINGSVLSDSKRTLTPELTATLDFGNVLNGEYNGDNSYYFSPTAGETLKEVFLADGEVDYMVGASTTPASNLNESSKRANILMRHCLSLVVFHIRKAEDNTIMGVVKSIDLKNINPTTGPLRRGSVDIHSKSFTPSASRMDYNRTMDGFPNSSHFGMMVYPATIGFGEVKLDLLVDEASRYTITLPARTWSSGRVYLYEVTLKPIGAELMDDVMVVDWITGKEIEFEVS